MEELIKKYEIQAKTLLDVLSSDKTKPIDADRAAACRRFVVGIIYDLKRCQLNED